jgi:hypothetical protein
MQRNTGNWNYKFTHTPATVCLAGSLLMPKFCTAAAFTAGNLVAERVGDGSAALGSAGTAVFLQEFSTNGASVQTIALAAANPRPTASPYNLLDSGSATSDGYLSLSADGRFLCIPGYNGTNGEASIATSASATVLRTFGVADALGNVDTSRAASTLTGGNFRGLTSSDGTNFWAVGQPGLVYFQAGVATNALTNSNLRCVRIFNNQLYASSGASSVGLGVSAIGVGLPTNGPVASTLILAVTGTSPSPYGFEFNPGFTVAYLADDRTAANGGGILKYTNSGTTWSLAYTLPTGSTVGARGLSVDWSGPSPVVYATTAENIANRLIAITDTKSTATAATLATAIANTVFRGLAFAPLAGSSSPVTTPVITGIHLSGGNVLIDFTGGTTDTTNNFSVIGTASLPGTPSSVPATITSSAPGVFQATIAATSPAAFYRIKR